MKVTTCSRNFAFSRFFLTPLILRLPALPVQADSVIFDDLARPAINVNGNIAFLAGVRLLDQEDFNPDFTIGSLWKHSQANGFELIAASNLTINNQVPGSEDEILWDAPRSFALNAQEDIAFEAPIGPISGGQISQSLFRTGSPLQEVVRSDNSLNVCGQSLVVDFSHWQPTSAAKPLKRVPPEMPTVVPARPAIRANWSLVSASRVAMQESSGTLNRKSGDLDNDCICNAADIDALASAISDGNTEPKFDLNDDGMVTFNNLIEMTLTIKRTLFEDANLEGNVNAEDLASVRTTFGATGGWADGKFNDDDIVDTNDLVEVRQNFGMLGESPPVA